MDEARYRNAERAMWDEVGVEPRERFVTLPRTGTSLRVQETGDGPPVVFVHGASNSGTSWSGLAAAIPDCRCLLIDRPGCGLSEPHGRRFESVADLAAFAGDLVVDVLDALELDRAFLVGTSFGGNVVLHATAAHPDRVTALACLGWSVGAPIEHTPLSMRLASIRGLGPLMARLPASRATVTALLKQVGLRDAIADGKVSDTFIEAYRALLNHTDTMTNELTQGPRLITPLRGLRDHALIADAVLANIRVPTLFLWGSDDPMGGEAVARPFAARVPGATLQMVRGGHAVWVDDPVGIAAALRSFFSG